MDQEGNIYDLAGNFIGTTDGEGEGNKVGFGDGAIVGERTIDVHIRALRRKLNTFADVVETVRGVGYRFRDPRVN